MWHSKFVSDNGSARRLSDKMILAHGRELLHVRNSPFVDRQHYHILVDGAQAGDILLYRGNEALLLTYINIDREYRGTGLAKNIFKSCQVAARFLALKQLTIFHVNNYNLIQIGSKIKNLKYHWPKENMFLTAAQILSLAEKMKIEFYNEEEQQELVFNKKGNDDYICAQNPKYFIEVDNKNKVQLYYKKLFGKKEEIKQINVVIPDLNVNMHIPVADEKINPNVLPSLVKIRITGR